MVFWFGTKWNGENELSAAGIRVSIGRVTFAEFKKKWSRYQGKETSAYQGHFDDLCRLLGQPTPTEADPSGSDFFCYQKRVVKDLELFDLEAPDVGDSTERGFADVWKKGCFGWEYKGKKKNLDEAYRQLLRYREALLNPPLLVVCDFDRYIIRTNFNGTVQETFEFTNDQIDRPENLRLLRALFESPDLLKPQRTTNEVTKALAEKFAEVARSLQGRESAELADAKTRAEVNVAQRKNLRIARFLNRLIFCFFAEDTGLLPKNLFSDIAKIALEDPHQFSQALESLFRTMAKGGMFGQHRIRHFNGHLFEDTTVFELNDDERRILVEAAEADWQFVEPSIMGTLFARGLDPSQRAALGAQYTSREDIVTLVEPVLMAPLRREWTALKASMLSALKRGRGTKADRARLDAFLKKLRKLVIMDPACGSGNFLYISLQMLLDLEKEAITFATQLGFQFKPEVGVHQLRAFEINGYAYELAQVTVQIGYLQWVRDNGFPLDRSPVLQTLDGFHNEDALLVPHYHSKAKTLKEAQASEHTEDNSLKFYTEREWPECDVLVGNPPFLGDKVMRGELGGAYVEELRRIYSNRIPGQSDLCCYWFEKARALIEAGKCGRAGLLATQNIRGGASRTVMERIKASGDIFFGVSDRDWVLDGAMVHISMVGFDDGTETERWLDGKRQPIIHADLSTGMDITQAKRLSENRSLGFLGSCKGGSFDLEEDEAMSLVREGGNPHGLPSSDVVRPVVNSDDLTKSRSKRWIIDNAGLSLQAAAQYEKPHRFVLERVKPHRDSNRDKWLRENWWRPQRMRPEMRRAVAPLARFIVTPTTSKHRVFAWLRFPTLPDHKLIVFARQDDYFFGILHSKAHELWCKKIGTQLRVRENGLNYNVESSFETFPLPRPTAAQEAAIAGAAKDLNDSREHWLNPAEWTEQRVLEFPGSINGPWSRYVANPDKHGLGTVRYPRLEPRDADCAAKLKKRTLTNLYNERPDWLVLAHKRLDAAVAVAYGWPADLTDDRILEKLLALNLERADEEEKAKRTKPARTSREKMADELV